MPKLKTTHNNKGNKTEQGNWMVNSAEQLKTRPKEGRCKLCKHKLSMSNLSQYCHAHQTKELRDLDDTTAFTPRRKYHGKS